MTEVDDDDVNDEIDDDDEVVDDDDEFDGAISVAGSSLRYMNKIFDVATIFLKLNLPTNRRASD